MTQSVTSTRSSNIELLRIIAMLAIVAHHFVVNLGVFDIMISHLGDIKTSFLLIFGMWGKTGINCFVLITGWFMCNKNISIRKYLKLLLEIYFYNICINLCFFVSGYNAFSIKAFLRILWPFWSIKDGFISCYLLFYLFIPFLNILLQHLTKHQHIYLLSLCLGIYTIIGSVPLFSISFNYISWFIIIYILASFLRLYPCNLFANKRFWRTSTLVSILLSISSVLLLEYTDALIRFIDRNSPGDFYFFVSDSNKILALWVSVSIFLWVKNIEIPNYTFINKVAASTFGVLLIHANSDTMRRWLWNDVVNCIGKYYYPLGHLIISAFGWVIAIFITCIIIDQLRIWLFERPFFKWYDKITIISISK